MDLLDIQIYLEELDRTFVIITIVLWSVIIGGILIDTTL